MMEAAARTPHSADDQLQDVLGRLGDRIAPITLAKERIIPVAEPLRGLFAEGGLVRGRVLSCRGEASSSMAFSLVREAMIGGAWLAVIDVATFGADAAAELGVPLERVVRVSTEVSAASPEAQVADWIDVMGAAVDGFDLVITRVPAALRQDRRPASVRKLSSRLQQRGSVVIVLGDTGALSNDVTLTSTRSVWSGLGQGAGHLRRRRIEVEAMGRRQPGTRSCMLDLVGGRQRVDVSVAVPEPLSVAPAATSDPVTPADDRGDPQEQVLAEMRSEIASRQAARGMSSDPGHLAAG